MKKSSTAFFVFVFGLLMVTSLHAQHGGKAEPKRIQFESGRTSAVVSGSLSNGQEMDFVFGARKGQMVTIRNATKSLFDFRVFSEENFPDGDFDSSPSYTFEVPETGDYFFFVRKKQVKTPRTARFSMTLLIK